MGNIYKENIMQALLTITLSREIEGVDSVDLKEAAAFLEYDLNDLGYDTKESTLEVYEQKDPQYVSEETISLSTSYKAATNATS